MAWGGSDGLMGSVAPGHLGQLEHLALRMYSIKIMCYHKFRNTFFCNPILICHKPPLVKKYPNSRNTSLPPGVLSFQVEFVEKFRLIEGMFFMLFWQYQNPPYQLVRECI